MLSKVSKAIAGALVTMLVAYLTKHGATFEPLVLSAVNTLAEALVSALVGYFAVYWAPKNKL